MRLENLYPNFGRATPDEQAKFVAEYRLRRATDLETIPKVKSKTSTPKVTLELSEEEQALAKLLGLKKKDILALRSQVSSEDLEESGVGEDLFKDEIFEEGEE